MNRTFVICILFVTITIMAQTIPQPASEKDFLDDIDRYVELMALRNPLFSLHSLDYILNYFGERAVPALIRGTSHSSAQVRGFSALALSKFPRKESIEPLLALLEDDGDIDLMTLSDDGLSIHSSYGEPLRYAVRENAWRSLQIITGKNFGELDPKQSEQCKIVIKQWKEWWQKEKDTWQPSVLPKLSNTWKDSVVFPIPEYAQYLAGVTICLDPGHGGDSEKIGYKRGPSGNREAESNLRLCRYLKDFLVQSKAKVLMTRDNDAFVSLNDRPDIAKYHKADIFISVHHNWSPRYTAQASTVWYHATPDYNPASMDLARYVFDAFTEQVPMSELDKTMGLKSDYLIFPNAGFAVLRQLSPEIPGILCELSYFSNLETELKMRDSKFLQKEAYGVFLGIAKYFYAGIPYWKVLQPEHTVLSKNSKTLFRIKIFDGLEYRKEWGCHLTRIFERHILVALDGKNIPFEYNNGLLTFTLTPDISEGKHSLQVWIIGLNKNHNWPRTWDFIVESK